MDGVVVMSGVCVGMGVLNEEEVMFGIGRTDSVLMS